MTTTEHPDANALAVSPPALEYAKGKLLGVKTAIGPIGIKVFRKSGLGFGFLFGKLCSIILFFQMSAILVQNVPD